MNRLIRDLFVASALSAVATLSISVQLHAQSQAMDATIEGLVRDPAGRGLPAAAVVARHTGTGLERATTTDERGRYRMPGMPPGSYRLELSAQAFKTEIRLDVGVQAGDLRIVNVVLSPGGISESVTVTADEDVTRAGQVDQGRVFTEAEASALPRVLRNPLNLVLLTPGVTGAEADELNQPRLNANGAQMRTAFQIDGNTNTQRDRAGLRLVTLSPFQIAATRVTTSGFAPEFGQMSGLVINVTTPSATNTPAGRVRMAFARPRWVARPPLLKPGDPDPTTRSTDLAVAAGGPLRRDRLHLYASYQFIARDSAAGTVTVASQDAAALGISLPPGGQFDEGQTEHFTLVRLDAHMPSGHRLVARVATFFNESPAVGASGLVTSDRNVDLSASMGTGALQVTSVPAPAIVNELRIQRAWRVTSRTAAAQASAQPAIDIPGVASFGGPFASSQSAGSSFEETIWQVVDNVSWQRGAHAAKAGVDLQWVADRRTNTRRRLYTFPTIDAYLAASGGTNPFAYTSYLEDTGEPVIRYRTRLASAFIQDDISVGSGLKVLAGLRYDLFGVPNPTPEGARVDRNNLAPRIGAAWALGAAARTVLRGFAGLVYDAPPLQLYQDALTAGPSAPLTTISVVAAAVGAPAFPASLSATAAQGSPLRPSIVRISPSFHTQATWQSSVQIDRAVGARASYSVGYVTAAGRGLPVLFDRNLVATSMTLDDGRPIYRSNVSDATRLDPAYDHVDVVEAAGRSRYHGVLTAFRARFDRGIQIDASYTWSRARDNAPLTNAYVQGSQDDRASDPSNLDRDEGPTPFDQRHVVSASAIYEIAGGSSPWVRWADGVTVAAIARLSSGLPVNLRANRDLNQDGRQNDRPVGIARNSASLGPTRYLDVQIERGWRSGARELRVFVAAKNLFDAMNVSSVNRVIPTTVTGYPLQPIPAVLPATGTFTSRSAEAGLTLRF